MSSEKKTNPADLFKSPVDTSDINDTIKKKRAEIEALAMQETINQTVKGYLQREDSNLPGLVGLCIDLVNKSGEPAAMILKAMSWGELFPSLASAPHHGQAKEDTAKHERAKAVQLSIEDQRALDESTIKTLSATRGATVDDIRKVLESNGFTHNNATVKESIDRLKAEGKARQEGNAPRGVRYFLAVKNSPAQAGNQAA